MSANGSHEYEYDLVTIGAGSGGVRASRFSAANYGAKVAVIELPYGLVSSENVGGAGGTCVIRGCVPKKLLVYASMFSGEYADAPGFGWAETDPKFDWNYLITNKGKEIDRLNSVYGSILKNAGVESIEGRARFVDAHTIAILSPSDGSTLRTVTAANILIASGASAQVLTFVEGHEHCITSDHALSLPEQPKRIVILGAGYIAVEFASIFSGLGTQVDIFFRKDLPLTGFDQECREMVSENLGRRANLHPRTGFVKVVKLSDGTFEFTYSKEDGSEGTVVADQVMMATGRVPNSGVLNLEAAGVKTQKGGGIPVTDLQRTNVPHIYALGDVTDKLQLTPVALMEGMAFASTCFGGEDKRPDYTHLATAVFTQPPLSTVGVSEEEAVEKYSGELKVFVSKFKPMKATLSGRPERTLMKMIVHADTDAVVGVHMVGPDSAEMMQGIAVALKAGAKKAHFDTTIGIHPTSAEEFVTMRSATRTLTGKGEATP